ncbi:hypothetical protein [Nocardia abscessus]|uniref:hypothetical protein n=1 Tax=Nocardia abscessus TaxID=120957 RepID=UPI0024548916|nr:hypothetical protein [Nocardia abscessus]
MSASEQVLIKSRTGKVFAAVFETDESGELWVLTKLDAGYKSAHRSFALTHFGGSVIRTEHSISTSTHGFRIVLTAWKAKNEKAGALNPLGGVFGPERAALGHGDLR